MATCDGSGYVTGACHTEAVDEIETCPCPPLILNAGEVYPTHLTLFNTRFNEGYNVQDTVYYILTGWGRGIKLLDEDGILISYFDNDSFDDLVPSPGNVNRMLFPCVCGIGDTLYFIHGINNTISGASYLITYDVPTASVTSVDYIEVNGGNPRDMAMIGDDIGIYFGTSGCYNTLGTTFFGTYVVTTGGIYVTGIPNESTSATTAPATMIRVGSVLWYGGSNPNKQCIATDFDGNTLFTKPQLDYQPAYTGRVVTHLGTFDGITRVALKTSDYTVTIYDENFNEIFVVTGGLEIGLQICRYGNNIAIGDDFVSWQGVSSSGKTTIYGVNGTEYNSLPSYVGAQGIPSSSLFGACVFTRSSIIVLPNEDLYYTQLRHARYDLNMVSVTSP